MPDFDVFNGDADGICALHQLRLCEPRAATLITGVKRDIALLSRVEAGLGERVTVLDISLKTNRDALLRLLEAGADVEYFDHHQAGEIPAAANLHAHIDPHAEVCTSLLVNRHLGGQQLIWAVVAAFGDNLADVARREAVALALSGEQLSELQTLGECLNYNGYGETPADLFFHPADLYRELHQHVDPFSFIRETATFQTLSQGYAQDMQQARAMRPMQANDVGVVYMLPDAAWARRVSGVFGNELATAAAHLAHAVLTEKDGGYLVSVRAPVGLRQGADTLCAQFESGGGRRGAAGINFLPASDLPRFLQLFDSTFRALRTHS